MYLSPKLILSFTVIVFYQLYTGYYRTITFEMTVVKYDHGNTSND